MICSAAQRGQGFGVDEYASEAEFRADIDDGFRFAVMDKSSGEMVAAFILAISKYSRGCAVADPFILVKDSQRGRRAGPAVHGAVRAAGRPPGLHGHVRGHLLQQHGHAPHHPVRARLEAGGLSAHGWRHDQRRGRRHPHLLQGPCAPKLTLLARGKKHTNTKKLWSLLIAYNK